MLARVWPSPSSSHTGCNEIRPWAYGPPLPSCSTQSPRTSHFYRLKAAVRPKVASLYAVHFLFLSFFFYSSLYFTSSVGSHLTRSCTKHLAPLLSRSLHVFASSISSGTHTRTHTHHAPVVFPGNYDTIQILLAAYAGKCVLRKTVLPQKSRFSPSGSFDPHGTRRLVSTVLCFSWRGQWTPIASLTPLCH